MNARAFSSNNQLSKPPKPRALGMRRLALPKRYGALSRSSSPTTPMSRSSPRRSRNVTLAAPRDENTPSQSTLVASIALALVERPQPRPSTRTPSTSLSALTFVTLKPNTIAYWRAVPIDTKLAERSLRSLTKLPVVGLFDRSSPPVASQFLVFLMQPLLNGGTLMGRDDGPTRLCGGARGRGVRAGRGVGMLRYSLGGCRRRISDTYRAFVSLRRHSSTHRHSSATHCRGSWAQAFARREKVSRGPSRSPERPAESLVAGGRGRLPFSG